MCQFAGTQFSPWCQVFIAASGPVLCLQWLMPPPPRLPAAFQRWGQRVGTRSWDLRTPARPFQEVFVSLRVTASVTTWKPTVGWSSGPCKTQHISPWGSSHRGTWALPGGRGPSSTEWQGQEAEAAPTDQALLNLDKTGRQGDSRGGGRTPGGGRTLVSLDTRSHSFLGARG